MPTYALDGVIVTCPDASPGTGDLTLGDPVNATGRTLAAAISEDSITLPATFFYTLYEDGDIFEAGTAQVSLSASVYTLARASATVVASSNSGSKISAAGNGATQVHFTTPEGRLLRSQDRGSNGGTLAETDQGQTFTGNQQVDGSLIIRSTDAGATKGPLIQKTRDSASPADDDEGAADQWIFDNDAGDPWIAAEAKAVAEDVTDGTEDGALVISAMRAGTLTEILRLSGENGAAFFGSALQGWDTVNGPSGWLKDNGTTVSGGMGALIDSDTVSGTPSAIELSGMSSTYRAYLLVADGILMSINASVVIRLGSGGVDSGASDYAWSRSSVAASTGSVTGGGDTADDSISTGLVTNTTKEGSLFAIIYNPAAVAPTMVNSKSVNDQGDIDSSGGLLVASKAVDTLHLIASGTTFTAGDARLYGLVNA